MSEMLDNILPWNFHKLALDEAFSPSQPQLKAPGPRLNRSASYFSPSSLSPSLSTEHVNIDEDDSSAWPSDIWSQVATSKPQQLPFRPDRSMSLTESSSALLSSFGHVKGLDPSSSSSSSLGPTMVAPPPGFPPLSSLPAQVPSSATNPASNRYKTELCRGFQETGSCKYGSKCQFAHGEEELRGMYRHPKYKTEPCRTFYNFGYCPYGTRCHFLHEDKANGGPAVGSKFQSQRHQVGTNTIASSQNPRHQLRQSVSFAGFLGSSRRSPPPSLPTTSFNDATLGFSRAPSVSPPPADLLSPVFTEALQREATAPGAFQFNHPPTRASTGDIQNIPIIVEPKPQCCSCRHGTNFPALNINSNNRVSPSLEDGLAQDIGTLFHGRGAFTKTPVLQRFSSEDSLEDSYSSSSSSGGSSGSESPTFDGAAGKRLSVFARLSLSD